MRNRATGLGAEAILNSALKLTRTMQTKAAIN